VLREWRRAAGDSGRVHARWRGWARLLRLLHARRRGWARLLRKKLDFINMKCPKTGIQKHREIGESETEKNRRERENGVPYPSPTPAAGSSPKAVPYPSHSTHHQSRAAKPWRSPDFSLPRFLPPWFFRTDEPDARFLCRGLRVMREFDFRKCEGITVIYYRDEAAVGLISKHKTTKK
jgi:hypothetical protein